MDTTTVTTAPADAAPAPAVTSADVSADVSGDVSSRAAAGSRGRQPRWLRGPEGDPAWARPALLGLLLATAVLYFSNLTANGYANSFYSAAAQAGSVSWKAFFFGSLDSSNAITVDKPPASLWLMALSVRALGLTSFAILLPEVLLGIGTVGVVYAAVKRSFGAAAGLIAGGVMALTPVAVLMFRFNNPDALLVFLMTLGAYATMRSIEKGQARWMALAGMFIGLGFLTKALQVVLVVPFFGIAYLLAATTTLRRRVVGALVGAGAMVLAAGWWVAVVQLVPASLRPYIGGSQTNSFLELTFGYNGFGRISGSEAGSVGPNSGTGSITRMFSSSVGGQVSWLIPSALILLAVGLVVRGRRPRTDLRRAAYLVWGGWLIVTGLTFSLMAGIFHEYYTVALAPAVAALVGMGTAELWEHRHRSIGSVTLAAATATAATWSFILLSRTTAYGDWLRVGVLVLGMAGALMFLVISRVHRRAVPFVVGAALVASLAGPAAYTLTTVTTAHSGSIVTAGPRTGGGFGGGGGLPGGGGGRFGGAPGGVRGAPRAGTGMAQAPSSTSRAGGNGLLDATTASTEVVAALSADAERYTWVAAAVGSQNAAGLQLGTQLPVMAVGGFNGSDPSPTLAQFQADAAQGRVHYFLAGGGFGRQNGGSDDASKIATWVAATYTQVTLGGQAFYDLTQPVPGSGSAATGSGSAATAG